MAMAMSQFQREIDRLASFTSWPQSTKTCCLTLARMGFYYSGTNLTVVCSYCNRRIDLSTDNDQFKCRRMHKDVSPGCPVVINPALVSLSLQLPDLNIRQRGTTETDYGKRQPTLQELFVDVCQRADRQGIFQEQILKLSLIDPDFDALRRECVRLTTFRNWPTAYPVNPNALAKDGFYYTGIGHSINCAFCRKFCDHWKPGDDAMAEHKKCFPDCAHVRGDFAICANITIDDDVLDDRVELIGMTQQFVSDELQPEACIRPNALLTSLHPVLNHESTEHLQNPGSPAMSEQIESMETLQRPGAMAPNGHNPMELTEVAGSAAKVVLQSDTAADFTSCASISQGASSLDLQPTASKTKGANNGPASLDLQHASSKNKNKQRKQKKKQNAKARSGSNSLHGNRPTVTAQEEAGCVASAEPERSQENTLQPAYNTREGLLEENKLLKEACTCKFCAKVEVNIVFLPCGHLVCCEECAKDLRLCPICRAQIRGTVKSFFVEA